MAMFQITTKNRKQVNGIRIEPGMSVQVVTQSMSNPVITNGGQIVVDAFSASMELISRRRVA